MPVPLSHFFLGLFSLILLIINLLALKWLQHPLCKIPGQSLAR